MDFSPHIFRIYIRALLNKSLEGVEVLGEDKSQQLIVVRINCQVKSS